RPPGGAAPAQPGGEYGEAPVSAGRIADATTVRDQLRQRATQLFLDADLTHWCCPTPGGWW
ncbi:MAG: hypothetical protein IPM99_06765, partial [Rubrivivax sp.]|nr:hypothetical protein [Rubrivivax sp.]